jgi:hypothetical protein
MAFLKKTDLKDVFNGLSSIYLKKGALTDFSSVTFDMDLPVTVDTLQISSSDPTLNRTKVHGLSADWTVSSTPGEITFAATIPSVSEELIKYFLGESNSVSASVTTTGDAQKFKGISATLNNVKLTVGLGLLSEDGEKLILVKKLIAYASPQYENGSSTPFAFKLTGTIEASDGDSTSDDDIAFLTKDNSVEGD